MMPQSRPPSRGRLQTNLLKVVLWGGAIASTFLGGRLLAQENAVAIDYGPEQQLIIPARRESVDLTVTAASVAQLNIPRPVTRTRSSR